MQIVASRKVHEEVEREFDARVVAQPSRIDPFATDITYRDVKNAKRSNETKACYREAYENVFRGRTPNHGLTSSNHFKRLVVKRGALGMVDNIGALVVDGCLGGWMQRAPLRRHSGRQHHRQPESSGASAHANLSPTPIARETKPTSFDQRSSPST